jgi:hypothetical protein
MELAKKSTKEQRQIYNRTYRTKHPEYNERVRESLRKRLLDETYKEYYNARVKAKRDAIKAAKIANGDIIRPRGRPISATYTKLYAEIYSNFSITI